MAQPSSRSEKPKTFWTEKTREAVTAYAFLAPFIFTIVVFFGYAFVRTIYYSFTDYDLFKAPNFVGLSNYTSIITEQLFRVALSNTLTFSFIVTALQTIGALLLAVS
jgi:multiple sugar transport system permease protein